MAFQEASLEGRDGVYCDSLGTIGYEIHALARRPIAEPARDFALTYGFGYCEVRMARTADF